MSNPRILKKIQSQKAADDEINCYSSQMLKLLAINQKSTHPEQLATVKNDYGDMDPERAKNIANIRYTLESSFCPYHNDSKKMQTLKNNSKVYSWHNFFKFYPEEIVERVWNGADHSVGYDKHSSPYNPQENDEAIESTFDTIFRCKGKHNN